MPTEYSSLEMLEKLVAFDSVSRNSNLPIIQFIQEYLSSYNIESDLVYNSDKTKANLFANVGPNEPGGTILSGHTDVVPIDGQNWDTDPFKIIEKDSKIYGRGTCDMKGFNAICLSLVPNMLQAELKKPIQLAFSYDEEVGCVGAPSMIRKMRQSLPTATSVIVGEPTMMKSVDGHKASIGLDTEVTGFEVHSSLLPTGVSAIMTAAELINWITQKTEENQKKEPHFEDKMFTPPFTTLHVGKINGGTAANITSKKCTFTMDIRCLPSDDGEALVKEYEDFAQSIQARIKKIRPEAGIAVSRHHWVPGLKPEKNGDAENLVRRLTGNNSTGKVSYGTEAGQFQEEGYSCIICGPGSIEQAHQANEYLDKSQLELGTKFIKSLITELSN
tara:strand:- start:226 stop:1389 length:1164 start_codon:yes stop_codon:yes gene_type:complete